MADRPILFSGAMVCALLADTKTQTRRILKPLPNRTIFFDAQKAGLNQYQSPRIAVGDRLYVREHWRTSGSIDSIAPRDMPQTAAILYNADDDQPVWAGKHRQAMHMPRWASRLTLTVTDVRVERLQDISKVDAMAEGIVEDDGSEPDIFYLPGSHLISGVNAPKGRLPIGQHNDPRLVYRDLVNNLHGGDLWKENPWIVAYSFTVERGNIDQIGRAAA